MAGRMQTELPMLLVTDLGCVKIVVREDEAWKLVPREVWPYPVVIETFGEEGKLLAPALRLTMEHVRRLHAAFGAVLAEEAMWENMRPEIPALPSKPQ